MTNIDPKIIDRIRKMQALAKDGGATEGEAQNAAAMAQRLMMEHNICAATVEAAGAAGTDKRTREAQTGRAMYDFQQSLMSEVSRINFCSCDVRYKGSRASGYQLIGREANVAATLGLFDYLMKTVERLGFEYVGSDNRKRMSRECMSFKRGAAERLVARLAQRHDEALAEQRAKEAAERAKHEGTSTGSSLVVMDNFVNSEEDLNNDHRFGYEPGTTARRRALGKVRDKANAAALKALREGVSTSDRAEATKTATAAAGAVFLVAGQDTSNPDVEVQMSYAVRWAVDTYMTEQETAAAMKAETPKQAAAREAKAQRESDRYWQKYDNARRAKSRATNWTAHRAGSEAGDSVGLDTQVGAKRAGALS